MKNTFVLAFGLFLLFVSAHAQSPSLPGYIVRNPGDTLRGLLQEQTMDESSRSVLFKSANEASYHTYTLAEVRAYQFDGGDLFRAVTYSDTRLDQPVDKRCFAKLLVAGEYDLYNFTEKEVLLFLARKDSSFYLMYDDDLMTTSGIKGNFRSELNFFSALCDAARGDVERATYTSGSMIAFFQKVDACLSPGKTVTTYYHKQPGKAGMFAYVGGIPLGNKSQFTAEAAFRLIWPKVSPNVSLNVGFRYANVVKRIINPNYQFGGITYPETFQIKSLPVTFQFNITKGIVQPFIYTGLSFVLVDVASQVPEIYRDNNHSTGVAFVVGAGIEVRLLHFLWARAEWRDEFISQWPTVGLALKFP
ncbi:MAG TPA: hypothetical protein VG052_17935 [Puia sp.]|jgi:hypothetical protein|nr:hypothetical protein [Puia sp.]